VTGLASLGYSLYREWDKTTTAILDGMAKLLLQVQGGDNLAVARVMFPHTVTALELLGKGQLVSFQGGEAVGMAISELTVRLALASLVGPGVTLPGLAFGAAGRALKMGLNAGVRATAAAVRLVQQVGNGYPVESGSKSGLGE